MKTEKIPKVIHYCWFGKNTKSDLIKNCIRSWKDKLPDYEIIEWNEDNFDVNSILYTKQAYELKKYAFVSDYARLWIINNYGGIYLDTDVEVLKSLDKFLDNQSFMAFEGKHGVNPGLIFGSIKENKVLTEIMKIYEHNEFLIDNERENLTSIVQHTTNILLKYGLKLDCNLKQNIEGIEVYPVEYFCPSKKTREQQSYSSNTYTAHHYDASWIKDSHKKRLENPIWKFIFKIIALSGKICKKCFGQKRWEKFRNKYLIKIYDFARGQ